MSIATASSFFPLLPKVFRKGRMSSLPFPSTACSNPAEIKIGDHGHIMMAFLEAELIDADALHLMKRDFAIEKLQPFLVDVFDQVPANPEEIGNRTDRCEPQHIEHREGKGSHIAMWKSRPPQSQTRSALQTMEDEFEHALLASDRAHGEEPSPFPFETGFAASANRAFDPLMVHLGAENDPVGKNGLLCTGCLSAQRRGKVCTWTWYGFPPYCSIDVKQHGPCHVHFYFSITGYSFAGRPNL